MCPPGPRRSPVTSVTMRRSDACTFSGGTPAFSSPAGRVGEQRVDVDDVARGDPQRRRGLAPVVAVGHRRRRGLEPMRARGLAVGRNGQPGAQQGPDAHGQAQARRHHARQPVVRVPAQHRDRRGAPIARRDDREYWTIFEGGATPRTAMHRRSNAGGTLTTGCSSASYPGPAWRSAGRSSRPSTPAAPPGWPPARTACRSGR